MSEAEDALLQEIRWLKLPPPVRELRFHPTRGWRFDLAWPDRLLAVEVEGGAFVGGRHTQGRAFEADCEKYDEAILMGWRVIRVTPRMIRDGKAIHYIQSLLKLRGSHR